SGVVREGSYLSVSIWVPAFHWAALTPLPFAAFSILIRHISQAPCTFILTVLSDKIPDAGGKFREYPSVINMKVNTRTKLVILKKVFISKLYFQSDCFGI